MNYNTKDIESQLLELRRLRLSVNSINILSSDMRHKRKSNPKFVRMNSQSCGQTKKINFYDQKIVVYNFLQRSPSGFISICYYIFVGCIVLFCLLLTILSTISDYSHRALYYLKIMDSFVLVFFSLEFLTRFWSSDCISHYRGFKGKIRFLRSPFRIIDLLIIYSTAAVLFFDDKSILISTSLRGLRFLQIFQVLKLKHRFSPWRTMASVVWAQRQQLAITTYMGSLMLLSISFMIYFVEKDINPKFDSLASSLWWGVVTLCTLGYGDMYPITPFGKLLTCFVGVIGISMFTLPAGILGTGLALKVEEQQRSRHISKRRTPAALLIQTIWRYYSLNKKSTNRMVFRKCSISNSKTNAEKNALKFILAVKYFIARRIFSEAFKPYDIKDIIEQYASVHSDILFKIKQMESKMDSIEAIVRSNRNTLQDSKHFTSSQMSKVEELLKDLNNRLNDFKQFNPIEED